MLSSIIAWAALAAILVVGSAALVVVSVLLVRQRNVMDALPAGVLALFFLGSAWTIAQYLGV